MFVYGNQTTFIYSLPQLLAPDTEKETDYLIHPADLKHLEEDVKIEEMYLQHLLHHEKEH